MTPSNKKRAPKGTVQVVISNGRLQLRFSHAGRRYSLSVYLPDSRTNRKVAEQKARQIELDIVSGHFDSTLEKYKPQHLHAGAAIAAPEVLALPSLADLWSKFVEFKRSQVEEATMVLVYENFTRYLEKLPTHDLSDTTKIQSYCLKTMPIESCRRFLNHLNACCNWAVGNKLIEVNPFESLPKLKPDKKSDDDDINPFTLSERDAILKAIEDDIFRRKHSSVKHSHYLPFTKFLFLSGCRPGEAIALQWKHIDRDLQFIDFQQSVSVTSKGRKVTGGLKTQKRRRFPVNEQMRSLIKSIKPDRLNPEALVFPGKAGKLLDTASMRRTCWKQVLGGLGIEYRSPYQCRHTFITIALQKGLTASDVAKLVGNSAEVIYKHYAGASRDLVVPEF
ncbi:Arm DNA-binding domain-containing protein [Phormidesmis sp. 146-33]